MELRKRKWLWGDLHSQIVSEEDYHFVDIDQESLFELILVIGLQQAVINSSFSVISIQAANFLNIKPLLDLTCGKVASMIKV